MPWLQFKEGILQQLSFCSCESNLPCSFILQLSCHDSCQNLIVPSFSCHGESNLPSLFCSCHDESNILHLSWREQFTFLARAILHLSWREQFTFWREQLPSLFCMTKQFTCHGESNVWQEQSTSLFCRREQFTVMAESNLPSALFCILQLSWREILQCHGENNLPSLSFCICHGESNLPSPYFAAVMTAQNNLPSLFCICHEQFTSFTLATLLQLHGCTLQLHGQFTIAMTNLPLLHLSCYLLYFA